MTGLSFIRTNSVNTHYQFFKNNLNQTLVFINALGTDFRIWDSVIRNMHPHANVLRFDAMGHGLSELASKNYEIEDYAKDVLALMDGLNIQKGVFVGLSMGGLIAQHLAIHHPERTDKIILSNTLPKVGTKENWDDRIKKVEKGGVAAVADAILDSWFNEQFHNTRKAEAHGYKTMLSNMSNAGYVAACKAIKNADFSKNYTTISVPTLVIGASQDKVTAVEDVLAMADSIPGARYLQVEGCGHIPSIDKPMRYGRYITDFLTIVPEEPVAELATVTG